jgi:hypothetical protein
VRRGGGPDVGRKGGSEVAPGQARGKGRAQGGREAELR